MRRLRVFLALATLMACRSTVPPPAVEGRAPPTTASTTEPPIRSSDQELGRKIGELVMVGFRGTKLDGPSAIARQVRAGQVGGVVLYDVDVITGGPRNIRSPDQLRALVSALQAAAPHRLLVGIDQEGGRVSRLKEQYGFPPTLSQEQLGERGDLALTRRQARETAGLLAEAGVNLNFAPVVDVNRNPDGAAIGALGRSFSSDPALVAAHARAVVEEHRSAGVLTALKHFPGHGSAAGDTHLGFVDVTGAWSAIELEPYRALVREGKADLVMTAHVLNRALDPAWPATLSPATITGLLRTDIGFTGPVVSDDLQMGAISDRFGLKEAVRQALAAGVDILLLGNNTPRGHDPDIASRVVALGVELVREGSLSEDRIDEALRRVQAVKGRLPPLRR